MIRRSTTFLIAAGMSVGIHAAMFWAFPHYEVGGIAIDWPADDLRPPEEMTVFLEDDAEPEPEPENPPEFVMGRKQASGYASHEVIDKSDATAREASNDQAFLSLDPAGAGDTGTDAVVAEAAGEGSTVGQPGGTPPPLVAAVVAPPGAESLTPFGLDPELKQPPASPAPAPEAAILMPFDESPRDAGDDEIPRPVDAPPQPIPPTPPAPVEPDAVAIVEKPRPSPTPAATPEDGGARPGGTHAPAADPAPMSDAESDPFSRLGTVVIRNGRLEIRSGRKVKTRRIKLLLASQVALLTMNRPQISLKIQTDETGAVTGVEVLKSSGNNELDQPVRVAVYDWWFEPKTNAAGRPVADEFEFGIEWR